MSMPAVLEGMQEWLRLKHHWKAQDCGIQMDAVPPLDSGKFYIAIDDGGIEAGDERTESLKLILTLNVGVWIRPEHLTRDQRASASLPVDKYVLGAKTLHDLVNTVVMSKNYGFHKNYIFMNWLNERYNLPSDEHGPNFTTPLIFRGRGRMETMGLVDNAGGTIAWCGYRLRFRGLQNEEKFSQ